MQINLQNHFLIAMPNIKNTMFKESVIYICEHNQTNIIGIIINKPLNSYNIKGILKNLNITTPTSCFSSNINNTIMYGGPKTPERGFIIHYKKELFYSSLNICNINIITNSRDILASNILDHKKNMLFVFGYCSWNINIFKEELLNNIWIIKLANYRILFDTPISKKWIQLIKTLKINQLQLFHQYNHVQLC